jgi:hypothetical protein
MRIEETVKIAVSLLEKQYKKEDIPEYVLPQLYTIIDPYYKKNNHLIEIRIPLKNGGSFVLFSALVDRATGESKIITAKETSLIPINDEILKVH